MGRLDAARYDALAERHGLSPLPGFGASGRLALVVASTRASWRPFLDALRARAVLREAEHPFDRWAAMLVEAAARGLGRSFEIRYPWEEGERRVAFVRLAALAGLGSVGPAGLLAHPELGPWLGLRAVVVVEADPGEGAGSERSGPCEGCAAPCERALQEARSARAAPGATEGWRRWLAVRESCPVGREARYGPAQLRYHYTKERRVLREALDGG